MSDIKMPFEDKEESEKIPNKKAEKIRKQTGGKDSLSGLKAQSREIQRDKMEDVTDQLQSKTGIEIDENDTDLLEKILGAYVTEESCYVVDNAIITCDHMSDKEVDIEYKEEAIKLSLGKKNIEIENTSGYTDLGIHFYKAHVGEEGIGRLRAVHATEQTDNGKLFATVIDRKCQREIDEGKSKGKASILSLGNCGILKESDVEEIESRREKAGKYGTCYCLMKLVSEWTNPICMESLINECQGIEFPVLTGPKSIGKKVCLTPSHNKMMKWDTANGRREGLTMLSTLLCERGGIISIEYSGQTMYIENFQREGQFQSDIESRIQILVSSVAGNPIVGSDGEKAKRMKELSTVEILSRILYQESRAVNNNGKNAVLFSIVNRLFSNKNFRKSTKNNSLYSIITGPNQYDSIIKDRGQYPNAYQPPIAENDNEDEKKSWENAKRLAAILCIAMEDYGEKNENYDNNREVFVIKSKDEETYQNIVNFIEQQKDIDNVAIINEIGGRESFRATNSIEAGKEGAIDVCGNTFFFE